ncbi:Pkinase-domain-containing protein, partial [Aureobasidium melanogenum]
LCLRKEPKERPSAKELLKHPWIRRAKRTTYLTELIERYERWQARHGGREEDDEDVRDASPPRSSEEEDLWDFGTVRPLSRRAPGLKVMNEAAMNTRNQTTVPEPQSPTKQSAPRGEENSTRRTVRAAPSMPPPPLPRDLSPAKQRPSSSSGPVPPSPSVAARVPLPASPIKKVVSQAPSEPPRTPQSINSRHANSQAQLKSTPQQINDDFIQQPIAADMSSYMKGLSVNDRANEPARPSTPSMQKQTSASNYSLSRSPEKPTSVPFPLERTSSSVSVQQQQQQAQQARLQQQQPLPAMVPRRSSPNEWPATTATSKPQAPELQGRLRQDSDAHNRARQNSDVQARSDAQLRTRQGSDAQLKTQQSFDSMQSSSSSSRPSSSSSSSVAGPSLPAQPQNDEITALSGVVIPALEAALHRRAYQLSLLQKSANTQSKVAPSPQDIMLKRQAHEQIRRLVSKVDRLMKDIDHWDSVAPVGMGDGVEGFLEGVLEEVLCRVEAEDA